MADHFRLRWLADASEDAEADFWLATDLAVWWTSAKLGRDLDAHNLLAQLSRAETCWHSFTMYMAFVDGHFFDLAKTTTANTIRRTSAPAPLVRDFMSLLQVVPRPSRGKQTLGRDVCLITAIAFAARLGWTPTHGASRHEKDSAVQKIQRRFAVFEYPVETDALARLWSRRASRLEEAGLEPRDLSEFSHSIVPVQEERG